MKKFCKECSLNASIEDEKKILDSIIVKKNHNLLDDSIIQLSQYIDKMIYRCVKCKSKLINTDNKKIPLDNIFGTHSTFYYYGEQHLFVNMYNYIKEGIKNNELIYLFVKEDIYDNLMEFLKANNVCTDNIQFKNVKALIQGNRKGGLEALKKEIYNIALQEDVKKYNGIRWIGQPSYAIELNSENDFLRFEENLDEALKNTNASLLCIYDIYDYMHNGKFINEEVIKESLDTHSYILKDLYLEALA